MVKTDKAWIFDEVIKDKKKVKKPIDSQLKVITKIGKKILLNWMRKLNQLKKN